MAAETVARDVVVVEIRRQPTVGRMAIVTGVAAIDMVGILASRGRAVVTARAGSEDLEVIHSAYRRKSRRRVAILADTSRRNVRRGFPRRTRAVMTAHAVRRNAEVIEKHREPTGSDMAGIALCLSNRVIGRLPDALHVVVARRAFAVNRVVIHFDQREPRRRSMTVFAEVAAQDVIRGFGRCPDARRDGVTGSAVRRRALKDSPDMAGLAVRRKMSPIELEAGGEVIEARIEARLSDRHGWHERDQGRNDSQMPPQRSDLNMPNDSVVWHS